MKEERPDPSLFIGLHRLAGQDGEGPVPELYALMKDRAQMLAGASNVIALPSRKTSVPSAARQQELAKILPDGASGWSERYNTRQAALKRAIAECADNAENADTCEITDCNEDW